MRLLLAALFSSLLCFGFQQQTLLIKGALVADGTGKPLRQADVRVSGKAITEVGSLKPNTGEQVVNGQNLVLAPGFIDMHNHSSELDADLDAESQVSQGITTALLGQDGGSAWPLADYLRHRTDKPAALNIQTLVGHATIRKEVMGEDYKRAARPEEIQRMAALVDRAMSEGAVGLSSGLEYEVGSYSNTEELVALAKAAAKHGGIYATHSRDEGDHFFDSLKEAIQIGEEARIPVEISHIKLGSAAVWGKAPEAVALIEAARKRGLDLTADCYPYDAWASTIKVLVLDKQYDNPTSVAKGLADVGGAENVLITSCKAHPDYENKNLAEIAKSQNTTAVALYSAIVRDGGAGIVCKAMKDSDIRTFYQQPWVMVGSDGGIGMRHPRGAGTFPRVLGVYVREDHWISLPDAIHKMTAEPAHRLKLHNRGEIRAGASADLVLFDPARVRDQADFAHPFALSTGIEKVFVNGALVWDSGKATGQHPGEVIR